jgi:NAD(P)-dependent dehydrogenase (short-subunit alcohol dehydrogenase family)
VNWDVGAGLEGKGVLITGASGGIGRAVARAMAATGARIMAVDLDQAALDDVVAGLDGDGHLGVAADLRDMSGLPGLIETAVRELGNLYVLVAVAGVQRRQDLFEVTERDWDVQHDVNLKSLFFLCRSAAEAMIRTGRGGRIISFTSQGWWTGGFGGNVVYAASKGGVVSMTRGLARVMGPHGITVNTVAPGIVRTPMLLDGLKPEMLESLTAQTPLGYVAEPEEIAGPVVFLASRHASYITGATLNVSGGLLMY